MKTSIWLKWFFPDEKLQFVKNESYPMKNLNFLGLQANRRKYSTLYMEYSELGKFFFVEKEAMNFNTWYFDEFKDMAD